jgi:non-ribosomal peptide synthase protein (TIGR01720 family)
MFSFASEATGQTSSEWGKRAYLLDVNSLVAGDRLKIQWTYNKSIHRPETIAELIEKYLDALRQIIKCSQPSLVVAVNSL